MKPNSAPLLAAALSLGLFFSPGVRAAEAPKVVKLWPDGAPGAKGDRPEDTPRLDVYCPDEDPCGAGVVICPGGGYGGLAIDHEGKQIAQFYNSIGVTAFVLSYRLGTQGYHHPIEVNDAKRALRWVREHAEEYNLDRNRIGLTGFSAGGHLASTAGTLFDAGDPNAPDRVDRASSRPDFLVLGYPVISLSDTFTHKGSRDNLLGPEKANEELAKQLSSQHNVTPQTPPTFIFQTDEDSAVPAENAVAFYLALRKHKVPAEMHIYQRGPHGVGLMHGDPVLSTWGKHLSDWLRNNGWLRPGQRAAVEGTVTVNGTPVSWGSVTFQPKDPLAPVVSVRLRNGKYATSANTGVPVGKHKVRVLFSAADVPTITAKDAPAGVVEVSRLSLETREDLNTEIKPDKNKLDIPLNWP